MPYKLKEGAIEQAKYRAKMAVHEAAHPTEQPRRVIWRWASAVAAVAVVVVGVVGLVKYHDNIFKPMSPMEQLVAEMKTASSDIVSDLAVDYNYYTDEEDYSL